MRDKSAKCGYRNLLQVPNYLYPDLQRLDVSFNRIDGLRNSSFYGYTELREIDLETNNVSFIEIGTFFDLKQLCVLQLSDNPIAKFSAQIFLHSIHLQFLGLRYANLEHIPNETVKFLPILSNLNLHSNRLSSINFTSCGTNEKQLMDLSLNRIEKLTPESFALNCTVVSLSLFDNPVQEVDPQTISSMSVQSLSLGGYKMSSTVLKHVFIGVSQSLIQELSITYVNLTNIPNGLFQPLRNKSLTKLDLSGNPVNLQESYFNFADLPLVSQLFVDDCNIFVIEPKYFDGMESLRFLSMKSNAMYSFNPSNSMWRVNLHVIDLSDNPLTKIDQFAFNGLKNLTTLFLIKIQNYRWIPWIVIDSTNLENLELSGSIFRYLLLNTPSLKYFMCRSIDASHFPFRPGETFQYAPLLTQMYLNEVGLDYIVLWSLDRQQSLFHGLANLELLDLSQNNIFDLFFGLFEGLTSLEVLDLADNKIIAITNDTFTGLTCLHTLNLRGNQLVSFVHDVLAHTKNVMNLYLDSNALDYLDNDVFCRIICLK